eukprot:XP_011605107.1 PREDICTED: zinc finger protein 276 isoform X2 [Takifugu rubripes]
MKKKNRPPSSSRTRGGPGEDNGALINRGRPRKDDASKDRPAAGDVPQKHPDSKAKSSGRLSTAICRLCHGKFSPRSLRHAFTWPQDSIGIAAEDSDAVSREPLFFHTDFQQLVGVPLDRDPRLSEFICKKCHAKFYKCHSILIRFLQRVNLPPVGEETLKHRKNAKCPESSVNHGPKTPASFTSDPKCLHSLVSWAHSHGEACRSCPNLKEVLEGQCLGSVKAVWSCLDGHRYIMDTTTNPEYTFSGALASGRDEERMSEEVEEDKEDQPNKNKRGTFSDLAQNNLLEHKAQTQSCAPAQWTCNSEDFSGPDEAFSPPAQPEDRAADSDLSDRVVSEDELEESRKEGMSDDEPYSDKRARKGTVLKRRRSPKTPEESKVKKKPGPKPGWKNKFKPKGEELPNIYKCPYQGCTAVYRAPDGLKKHIKEHHEEVRERPCPHPGCNKVFMIDRYLQRHVKLIHTEERNYICDQCGQTFKQRKHLSVHQMRHSGAKPLQCEVCGFQCRQRASLKYHMTKHKAEADLEFACQICEKRFEKAHNLNVHMSMVHPLTHAEGQRGSSQQPPPLYDLQTIALSGEAAHQDQER